MMQQTCIHILVYTVLIMDLFISFFSLKLYVTCQLLEVDPSSRLGSQGADSIKNHQWFTGVEWDAITKGHSPVPPEIVSRINYYVENHAEDFSLPFVPQSTDSGDLGTLEWLDDW